MFTYLVQTVNNMYQNVSDKSIENQEFILRVIFLLWTYAAFEQHGIQKEMVMWSVLLKVPLPLGGVFKLFLEKLTSF